MKKPLTLDARPVRVETISPEAYLRLLEQQPTTIRRAAFLPPQPGKPGFGSFQVTYSRPRYKVFAYG